ncbi:MAG: IS1595 family transposase [Bacteroidales bacterium]|nr:IS1595 family transposase [Bacteroidales bacterium]
MMKFKGENILEFTQNFPDDFSCLQYLSDIKWSSGYKCIRCGHTKYTVRKKNLARDCNRCHHIESPTANTIFHRLRFGIRKAFTIVFEMSATTKGLSATQVSKRYSISRTTAWTFMHKIRSAMKSSCKYKLKADVQVDEFVFGGKETHKQGRSKDSKKKKIIGALELSESGKVKRAYFKKIEDYSSKSLIKIFDSHISTEAQVSTDKWTGYAPISRQFNIEQKYSDKGGSMKQMHTIIHQVKSWLRSVYSWVHEEHIEKYLDEYSFRINRSIYKQTIFHSLINRMVIAQPITCQAIKISN